MEQKVKNVSAQSNEIRNQYVIQQIMNATLDLLKEKELNSISISQLCDQAQVWRTSFYRNFEDKEAIVKRIIHQQFDDWDLLEKTKEVDFTTYFSVLTSYIKDHKEFYTLLTERHLLELFLEVLLEINGPREEDVNAWAYTKAFLFYGTYGWLKEWISRGMQESGDDLTKLFKQVGQ